tara:strand:+ start:3345 stop:3737 length:393 start_codon:yes stop_codon:yes gene_type:complete
MANQIMIFPNESILVNDSFHIKWVNKGNAMPSLNDNTIHAIVYNDQPGDNEIQRKDPSTGDMTGNTLFTSKSDAVGDTTLQELLDWGSTRQAQIETAQLKWMEALTTYVESGNDESTFDKTWIDYDPNYS